jgi:hypothetical protein
MRITAKARSKDAHGFKSTIVVFMLGFSVGQQLLTPLSLLCSASLWILIAPSSGQIGMGAKSL